MPTIRATRRTTIVKPQNINLNLIAIEAELNKIDPLLPIKDQNLEVKRILDLLILKKIKFEEYYCLIRGRDRFRCILIALLPKYCIIENGIHRKLSIDLNQIILIFKYYKEINGKNSSISNFIIRLFKYNAPGLNPSTYELMKHKYSLLKIINTCKIYITVRFKVPYDLYTKIIEKRFSNRNTYTKLEFRQRKTMKEFNRFQSLINYNSINIDNIRYLKVSYTNLVVLGLQRFIKQY